MCEIVISSLKKISKNPEEISEKSSYDKWQTMEFSAGDIKGEMLVAGELCHPRNLVLSPNITGWYKIFVATVNLKSTNYFCMRLSSDEGFSGMRDPSSGKKFMWTPLEYTEEFFWKCACLTGEDIILSKPDSHFRNACSIAWLRFVPMTEEEIAAYQKPGDGSVHIHFDEDTNAEDSLDSNEALLTRFASLKGTDVGECSLEISFDYDTPEHEEIPTLLANDFGWHRGDAEFLKLKDKAYKLRTDFLHKNGIKAYAANRMSVAEFTPPYTNLHWTYKSFVRNHPEYYCTLRDGSNIAVCSYAFAEVRSYVIDNLLSFMKYGFDGLTLIYHRGLHIGFDAPCISLFEERYPGVDPFSLPVTDERLSSVWCDIMTDFMRALRSALTEKCGKDAKINVIVDYSPKTSKHFGLDVEKWAKEGLVDSVLQGIMEMYEDLDGTLDGEGKIIIDKYCEKLKSEPVLRRYHSTDIEKISAGARDYLEICKGYGVEFYATLPWPHKCPPEEYKEYRKALNELGAEKFLSWNTNHLLYDLPEAHAALSFTKADEEWYIPRRVRTTSLAGSNIAIFNPNWRG